MRRKILRLIGIKIRVTKRKHLVILNQDKTKKLEVSMGIITQISKEMKRVLAESADRAAQVAGLIQRERKVNSRNLGQTLIMG